MTDLSFDGKAEYLASCSVDGTVVVSAAYRLCSSRGQVALAGKPLLGDCQEARKPGCLAPLVLALLVAAGSLLAQVLHLHLKISLATTR